MVKPPRQPPRWDRPQPGHPRPPGAQRGTAPPGPISIPRLAEGAEEQGNEATRCLCSTSSRRKDFSRPSYPGRAARSALPALNALFRFTWSSALSPEPRALVHNLIATDHKAWLKEDSQALLTPSWVQIQAAHQCALTKADNPALPQDPPTDHGPGAAPPWLLCSGGGLKSGTVPRQHGDRCSTGCMSPGTPRDQPLGCPCPAATLLELLVRPQGTEPPLPTPAMTTGSVGQGEASRQALSQQDVGLERRNV